MIHKLIIYEITDKNKGIWNFSYLEICTWYTEMVQYQYPMGLLYAPFKKHAIVTFICRSILSPMITPNYSDELSSWLKRESNKSFYWLWYGNILGYTKKKRLYFCYIMKHWKIYIKQEHFNISIYISNTSHDNIKFSN